MIFDSNSDIRSLEIDLNSPIIPAMREVPSKSNATVHFSELSHLLWTDTSCSSTSHIPRINAERQVSRFILFASLGGFAQVAAPPAVVLLCPLGRRDPKQRDELMSSIHRIPGNPGIADAPRKSRRSTYHLALASVLGGQKTTNRLSRHDEG